EALPRPSDLGHAFSVLDPPERTRPALDLVPSPLTVRGAERVLRERVLDVREDQLLVLLLMVEADLDDLRDLGVPALPELTERARELRVDVRAIAIDLLDRGPGEEPSPGTAVAVAHGVVIRVEQVAIPRVIRRDPQRREDERLEEPGGV